jgi:hypothetical protein
MMPSRPLPSLAAAFLALLLAGCDTLPRAKPDGARTGPFYAPANVRAVERLPETVRRIVLLPCGAADPRITEDTLRDLDGILAAGLTRSARAEISTLDRETLARFSGRPNLLSTSLLPADFLARVVAQTGADAVLFVDVTAYSPYPPLVLGLRARLVEARAADPLWNFDNIVSTADPAVVNSARARALRSTGTASAPGDRSHTVLQNPLAFADYVADVAWNTLPPR